MSKELIKEMEIPSTDGAKTYTLKLFKITGDDGNEEFERECTCKGFQFRSFCKHLDYLEEE